MANAKGNDLEASVPKFCLLLEEDRRTPEGRVQSAKQFREHYFTYSSTSSTDRVFKYLPREVRGPILTSWGIRGPKSALRDDDEKVQEIVCEALTAGDIDDDLFEEALLPKVVIRWVDLSDWWSFWRQGKLNKHSIRMALESAYRVGLFDATWFFDSIQTPGGRLRGTDVLGDVLTKTELVEWVRNIHQSRDGTPKGLIAALGWEKIVMKTADDVLIALLDAIASKRGLSKEASASASGTSGTSAASGASAASARASAPPASTSTAPARAEEAAEASSGPVLAVVEDVRPDSQIVDIELDAMTELPDEANADDQDGEALDQVPYDPDDGSDEDEDTGVIRVDSVSPAKSGTSSRERKKGHSGSTRPGNKH